MISLRLLVCFDFLWSCRAIINKLASCHTVVTHRKRWRDKLNGNRNLAANQQSRWCQRGDQWDSLFQTKAHASHACWGLIIKDTEPCSWHPLGSVWATIKRHFDCQWKLRGKEALGLKSLNFFLDIGTTKGPQESQIFADYIIIHVHKEWVNNPINTSVFLNYSRERGRLEGSLEQMPGNITIVIIIKHNAHCCHCVYTVDQRQGAPPPCLWRWYQDILILVVSWLHELRTREEVAME